MEEKDIEIIGIDINGEIREVGDKCAMRYYLTIDCGEESPEKAEKLKQELLNSTK